MQLPFVMDLTISVLEIGELSFYLIREKMAQSLYGEAWEGVYEVKWRV